MVHENHILDFRFAIFDWKGHDNDGWRMPLLCRQNRKSEIENTFLRYSVVNMR